jgi:GntR family transcriptional regulator, transcriptional repressor for pyruvate dehydrogenase complex
MSEGRRPDFGPIKPKRVFEEICARIRSEIAAGSLRPGDKLPPERDLAETFNVSRTAVREALRSLEMAGLVGLQKGAKGGAFILDGNPTLTRSLQDMISLGRISLADLTEARTLVQEVVVRLACARATEADLAALEHDIDEVEALTRNGRLRERLDYSINFYKILANITKNRVIIILIDSLTYILRLVVSEVGPEPKNDLVETRRAFVKCLRARDADGAVREMTAHLERLHDHLARAQRKSSPRMVRSRVGAEG